MLRKGPNASNYAVFALIIKWLNTHDTRCLRKGIFVARFVLVSLRLVSDRFDIALVERSEFIKLYLWHQGG